MVLPLAIAKKPTTMSPGTVAVTDGAVGNLVFGSDAPLCESIGVRRSTFLKSRIAPVPEADELSVHAYSAGSAEPATL
jgi:hypothetical protein